MFTEVFGFYREQVFLIARSVPNIEGNEPVMQIIVADWQETHHHRRRIRGLGHNHNLLAGVKPASPIEGDRRGEKILNLRVAAVNDLPNLALARAWRWFVHK